MKTTIKSSESWHIETRVALCPNDLAMVMAVRAATFLAEEDNITYADEFNGNDHVATHILALVDGDPAGTMRIRWFRDFAVLERICVRKRYRTFRVFRCLANAAIEHLRTKGWKIAIGRARGNTHMLWRRLFKGRPTGKPIYLSRGIVLPIRLEFPELSSDTFSDLTLGKPEVEDLIVQLESRWDFTKLRIAAAHNAA
jgi:hypothetical protein